MPSTFDQSRSRLRGTRLSLLHAFVKSANLTKAIGTLSGTEKQVNTTSAAITLTNAKTRSAKLRVGFQHRRGYRDGDSTDDCG